MQPLKNENAHQPMEMIQNPKMGREAKREEGEKECPGEVVGSRHLSWQNPADIEEGPRKPTHVREQQGSLRWN
jgi:hypothetical protein